MALYDVNARLCYERRVTNHRFLRDSDAQCNSELTGLSHARMVYGLREDSQALST